MIKKLFIGIVICILLIAAIPEMEKMLQENSGEISQQVSEVGESIKDATKSLFSSNKSESMDTEIEEIEVKDLPNEVQSYYERYKNDKWNTKTSDLEGRTKAGENFENEPRTGEETLLPKKTDDGKKIKYKEFDAEYTPKGAKRGKKRFVHGSDGSTYYTDDHYKSYKKITE